MIQAEVSDPVAAPANAKVLEVGSNEEIGNFVVLDLGNEYTATCGQLKEISAVPGELSGSRADLRIRGRTYKILFRRRCECIF